MPSAIARSCLEMERVGWELVTVPAGTFRAMHIKHAGEQTEAWVLPDPAAAELFLQAIRGPEQALQTFRQFSHGRLR